MVKHSGILVIEITVILHCTKQAKYNPPKHYLLIKMVPLDHVSMPNFVLCLKVLNLLKISVYSYP